MTTSGAAADKAELIKWWDALDELRDSCDEPGKLQKALQLVRECRHADAQWLAALFPAGASVTEDEVLRVMRGQGDDPRALHVLAELSDESLPLLRRAAAMGYAPAQAQLSWELLIYGKDEEAFEWAEKAAAQGDRYGIAQQAEFLLTGRLTVKNSTRALALYKEAGELGNGWACFRFSKLAFGERDWQRYRWWGRAVERGCMPSDLLEASRTFVAHFEAGQLGRILFEVAPVIKGLANRGQIRQLNAHDQKIWRIVELWEARCGMAKRAIYCWSGVGRRLGVVKDMRVKIAKVAWEQRWAWGEVEESGGEQAADEEAGKRARHE